jgi:hypothetical protein
VVEVARLESVYRFIAYRGFESPSLRQETKIGHPRVAYFFVAWRREAGPLRALRGGFEGLAPAGACLPNRHFAAATRQPRAPRAREACTHPQRIVQIGFTSSRRRHTIVTKQPRHRPRIPVQPLDLARHRGLLRRLLSSGRLAPWTLKNQAGEEVVASVRPVMVPDDPEAIARAAAGGMGIAMLPLPHVQPLLERGKLMCVLPKKCPMIPALVDHRPGDAGRDRQLPDPQTMGVAAPTLLKPTSASR